MLQGWNNSYYKTNEMSDGCPIYRLDAYTLYWFIPIIGVEIKRVNGLWGFYRECDRGFATFTKNTGDKGHLFGKWGPYGGPYGMEVSHPF
jgi:hypothetical protein